MRICCAFLLGGGEAVENENENTILSVKQSATVTVLCEECKPKVLICESCI